MNLKHKYQYLTLSIFINDFQVPDEHRALMHAEITPLNRPRTPTDYPDPGNPLIVLWSRDAQLDNRPGAAFEPNHVVPLVKKTASSEPTSPSLQKRRAVDNKTSSSANKKKKGMCSLTKYP